MKATELKFEMIEAIEQANVEAIQKVIKQAAFLENKQDRIAIALPLWKSFGNVPVTDDMEIDEDWLMFCEFTDCTDIWRWFEESFEISVGDDLMYKIS